mgnify:CR=1 FL=1
MSKRKHLSPEEKVAVVRRHLLENVSVSDLCDEHGLHPAVYYRWQKELFEGGAADLNQRAHMVALEMSYLWMKLR